MGRGAAVDLQEGCGYPEQREVVEGFVGGGLGWWFVTWWCHFLTVGPWAASPPLREILEAQLPAWKVSVVGSRTFQSSFWEQSVRRDPQKCADAFLLGSWGLCPSLRNLWAPASPHPHPVLPNV